jgi:branched-chain amino acid transport system ATP-binding protein
METGRIVMDDTSETLRDNEDIKDFYLGIDRQGWRKEFPGRETLQAQEKMVGISS